MIYRKRYYFRHPLVFWRLAVTRPILKFVQRGRHGWSPQDAWSFDTYLAEVISEGCTHLRAGHSYPGNLEPEKWDEILEKIASGFGDYVMGRFEWLDDDPGYARFHESMELFVKWFGNLWD